MEHEALFTSVLGAAPTLLVAYVVEDRLMERYNGHVYGSIRWFRLVIILGCLVSFVTALLALFAAPPEQDHLYARLTVFPLSFAFGGFSGVLIYNLGFMGFLGHRRK
jgi:hypothetical protein